MGVSCRATNAKGEPCRSTSVDESGLCAFHGGRSPVGTGEMAHQASRAAVEARRRRAEIRKRTALDWAAHIVEENGRELAESFLSAARNGDWRAAEALMNRIYGKPEQPLAVTRPEPSALQAFARSLSLEMGAQAVAAARALRAKSAAMKAPDGRARRGLRSLDSRCCRLGSSTALDQTACDC